MATDADPDQDWADDWSRLDPSAIATAWIDYQARDVAGGVEDEDWWAVDAMLGLQSRDPIRALEICFLIGRSSDDAKVLAMLGAAPLEDLLSEDSTLLDAVAIEARTSPNLRLALRSIWQSTMPDHVWATLQHIAR